MDIEHLSAGSQNKTKQTSKTCPGGFWVGRMLNKMSLWLACEELFCIEASALWWGWLWRCDRLQSEGLSPSALPLGFVLIAVPVNVNHVYQYTH